MQPSRIVNIYVNIYDRFFGNIHLIVIHSSCIVSNKFEVSTAFQLFSSQYY